MVVEKNLKKVVSLYEAAAKKGYRLAEAKLGGMGISTLD